ncbi:FAD-linked oxidase C-terminal domain-containing protein [Ornithinimicrobium pratense]|nr:FAD-linked oxidase C-terminal domain-containing protein [Ornithinimicrobium pratense]
MATRPEVGPEVLGMAPEGEAERIAQQTPSADGQPRGTARQVLEDLRGSIPEHLLLTDPAQLTTYECDGLAAYRVTPALVVLADTAEQVAATVRSCATHRVPFVARGSGTGLSGGALPHAEGVLVVTSRLRTLHEVRPQDQRAVVDTGVINLQVSKAAGPVGYYFAPDPSSQQICSVGGNVAENSGGAHCLKYGFTSGHVLSLDLVTPTGAEVTIGTEAPDAPGYDLVGAFVGSEGTLGIATRAVVRLTRLPEEVRTVLAGFETTDQAGAATSAIIAAGIVPAAIEIMDALAIEAAEAAVSCGYPQGAGAVLVVELDGAAQEVAHEYAAVEAICQQEGCFEFRMATDATERAEIWKGRKSAFAAVGRISPDYIVQDGVVPRTSLPAVLRRMSEISAERGVRVANVFHAGDGNLHPLVLFDASEEGATKRAEEVSGMILDLCIEHGGSITGEHGVGSDKARYMPRMFTDDDLDTMQLVRCAFDPDGIANPGKIYPTPRLCGERPRVRQGAHPMTGDGVEVF